MALFNETRSLNLPLSGDLSYQNTRPVLFAFYYVVWPILTIIGISGNLVNIIVFMNIGLKEGVTVSLLALSVSDMAFLILSVAINVAACIAMSPLSKALPLNMYQLSGNVSSYQSMAFYTSMGITTYIAVARCCCVAMPLKFRHVFTVQRTAFTLCLIALICIVSRLPYVFQMGLMWVTDSKTNTTRLTMWYSDNFSSYYNAKVLLNQTIYPFTVLGILSICSFILTYALVKASKLRQEMTGDLGRTQNTNKALPQSDTGVSGKNKASVGEHAMNTGDSTLSVKEIRVVQAVVLVTLFLLLTVLIMSSRAIAQFIVPELTPGYRLRNISRILTVVELTISYINASVNVAIYYKLNTKFKKTVKLLTKGEKA